ncbi:MAG: ABC transporter ATP-binding protein [SAR324 cluster bacterium]|nr:ABC transporter ATP-binding protein [SAR324 cluster bacterium]
MRIEVKQLNKSYHDGEGQRLHILRGVTFAAQSGSTTAIVGASGTGKSTFLHLLGGLDSADTGQILVGDQDLSTMNRNQCALFRNRKVGFIFQFHHLLQDFNALENVMMPLIIGGKSYPEASQQAMAILKEVGLGDRHSHKPSQLSGGEQQRVAIARAIAHKPSILLADEPTGNLDQNNGEHVMELLLRLNQELGLTLIMITHNPSLAQALSQCYEMREGQLHLQ